MSLIAQVDLEVTSLDILRKACESLGEVEFMENQHSYKCYGPAGEPMPDGFMQSDVGRCEHAIRVKGRQNTTTYEIGVMKRRDGQPGFVLHMDNWDNGKGLCQVVGNNASKLAQHYAAEQIKATAIAEGVLEKNIRSEWVDGNLEIDVVYTDGSFNDGSSDWAATDY